MSLGGKIRKLDIYKKIPTDLSEGTNIGGLISITTTILIIFLLYNQLNAYFNPNFTATLSQEKFFTRDQMRINVDIQFPRFPCQVISLDLQDIMLSHHPNIGSIKKWRLDSDGNYLDSGDFELLRQPNINKQYQMSRTAFQKQYGCRVKGSFTVKQVPGNFHISSHAYGNIFMRLSLQGILKDLNVSHIVHDLHFGEISDISQIAQSHPESVVSKLNGNKVIYGQNQSGGYTSHYHIDVVPTVYYESFFNKFQAFQYTYNHNSFPTNGMPVLYFNYHIGGLTVFISPEASGLLFFIIKLCAIIGGTYTLASFMDTVLNRIFGNKYNYQLIQ